MSEVAAAACSLSNRFSTTSKVSSFLGKTKRNSDWTVAIVTGGFRKPDVSQQSENNRDSTLPQFIFVQRSEVGFNAFRHCRLYYPSAGTLANAKKRRDIEQKLNTHKLSVESI
jgi:hypothetical protein